MKSVGTRTRQFLCWISLLLLLVTSTTCFEGIVPTRTAGPRPSFLSASKQSQSESILETLSQVCKGATATALVGAVLCFGSPALNLLDHSRHPLANAWAADVNQQTVVDKKSAQQQQPESMLTKGEAPMPQASNVVEEVWNLIDKYYVDRDFNGQDWNEVKTKYMALNAKNKDNNDDKTMDVVTKMVKSLGDKYSRVLSKDAYAAIQKYDLIGVGATLMPNEQKQIIVGAPPIKGSVAEKSGLQVGDFIDAVNGVKTAGRSAFDIIDQISDNPTAKTVTMTVRSPNEGTTRDVVMERQTMEIKDPIRYKLTERRKDGTVVGYIRISEFNSLIKAKLEEAILDLESRGVNAIVLDLRGNPGGAFQSAVEISSLFYENKIATYVVDSNSVELPFKTATGRVMVPENQPVAIWIDGSSASASEVFAGSLHDNCRGVVMGDTSFGKGLIQAVYGLKNGAGLVLTVAKYITPNGNEIQGNGIIPDVAGNLPNPIFQPADTTKIDFDDIASRLGPEMCQIPNQATSRTAAAVLAK